MTDRLWFFRLVYLADISQKQMKYLSLQGKWQYLLMVLKIELSNENNFGKFLSTHTICGDTNGFGLLKFYSEMC